MPQIYCRQVRTRGLRPDWNQVIKSVEQAMDVSAKSDILSYFNRIVAHWKEEDRPAFRAMKRITKQAIKIYVYPTGPNKNIWKWVSVTGCKARTITIRVAEWLRFRWAGPGSYKARTTKSGGYKGPGVAIGPLVRMKMVDWPGFDPRNFEAHIATWYRKRFYKIVNNAFKRGIRQAKARAKQ